MADPAIVKQLALYGGIVLAKTILMPLLTMYYRFKNESFTNPEDGRKVNREDPDVERVRRAHQNDVENVFAFVFVALLYVYTANPSSLVALWHFRIFTVSRLFYTVAYLCKIPQPARAYAYRLGHCTTSSMLAIVLTNAIFY